MVGLALVVVLGAADVAPAEVVAENPVSISREAARFRWGVSGVFAAGFGLNHRALGLGPGVSVELGGAFNDRVALVGRVTIATILMAAASSAGAALDFALSDQWSLSAGLAVGYVGAMVADLPVAVTAGVPLRVTFSPHVRGPELVRRQGLQLFLELLPAVELTGAYGYGAQPSTNPPFSASATVGVGYGVW